MSMGGRPLERELAYIATRKVEARHRTHATAAASGRLAAICAAARFALASVASASNPAWPPQAQTTYTFRRPGRVGPGRPATPPLAAVTRELATTIWGRN